MYYGNRNHHVRRISLETMEALPSFEPPHFDAVTTLAQSLDCLVSG